MKDDRINRVILVVGETGTGKSTIVNMLYNQDSSVSCCQQPCQTGATASSVTKASAMHLNIRTGWLHVDTVGVGDPDLQTPDILDNIRKFIRDTSLGVHAVVVVMKMGRVSQGTRANMRLLEHLFHAEGVKSNGLLLLTHWQGELGEEDKDLEEWMGEDKQIIDLVGRFNQVVLTNNQIRGRAAYPECREQCLRKRRSFIDCQEAKIKARAVGLWEVFQDIVSSFFHSLAGHVLSLQGLVVGSHNLPTFCGECAVCLEQTELSTACKLSCNHSFHERCLEGLTHCPICRAEVTDVLSIFSLLDY
ncbi:Gimap4 [Symbiodinium natans]|uniref:Gimap4 protein n=1 Tax=Symbiodinium natans TaxID=878477 RepID=A0A812PM21_9DINO|nr:Gimap4 [Symbiodinium natans]